MPKDKSRCSWVSDEQIYIDYHDKEWGVPIYDDRLLFEFLILEGAQAGLSWITILKRRENYRKAFNNFNAEKIAKYDAKKIKSLLANEGIIRNRLKIAATIGNAKAYLNVKKEYKKFSDYIWQFVDGKPIQKDGKKISEVMSKDLKKRGFKFVGATICYAFMQAVGMINDHTANCFRRKELC